MTAKSMIWVGLSKAASAARYLTPMGTLSVFSQPHLGQMPQLPSPHACFRSWSICVDSSICFTSMVCILSIHINLAQRLSCFSNTCKLPRCFPKTLSFRSGSVPFTSSKHLFFISRSVSVPIFIRSQSGSLILPLSPLPNTMALTEAAPASLHSHMQTASVLQRTTTPPRCRPRWAS